MVHHGPASYVAGTSTQMSAGRTRLMTLVPSRCSAISLGMTLLKTRKVAKQMGDGNLSSKSRSVALTHTHTHRGTFLVRCKLMFSHGLWHRHMKKCQLWTLWCLQSDTCARNLLLSSQWSRPTQSCYYCWAGNLLH